MKTPAEVLNMLFKGYTYRLDKKNYGREQMDSHFEEVMEGRDWSDDCDGFAATAAEVLIHEGYPRESIKLVICEIKSKREMHLICALDTDKDTICLDCNFHDIYSWGKRNEYKWLYYMPLDEPGQWYKIEE